MLVGNLNHLCVIDERALQKLIDHPSSPKRLRMIQAFIANPLPKNRLTCCEPQCSNIVAVQGCYKVGP